MTACKSNLKNLATALEMYSTDNVVLGGPRGMDKLSPYPHSLGALTPNYLKILPNCPAAQKDTYSPTYQRAEQPEAFTVRCGGMNHSQANTPAEFPRYDSYQGLIERP
ncbi:MAG: hypothetical protein AMXMBFR33_45350 [Candidatus Xenobia bacterium]